MDNHFNLLVETAEPNLSRAMQWGKNRDVPKGSRKNEKKIGVTH